jgi:hypothetical protein
MAVAICTAPAVTLPKALQADDQQVSERFYKFATPSPQASSPAAAYSDLEDSGFHSDEDLQKVSVELLFTRARAWLEQKFMVWGTRQSYS